MKYLYSAIDKKNLAWFEKNFSCQSLKSIQLANGTIRGLCPFGIEFKYPISAIAGRNGSGKSTILAMATCAYHDNNGAYYTFGNFLVQAKNEKPLGGIVISYGIMHDRWRNLKPSLGYQRMKKSHSGRWSNYERRVSRPVYYFGIQRLVPHYESSTHKNYKKLFKDQNINPAILDQVKLIAGKILGKNYQKYEIHGHSKYTLPCITSNETYYSGFNMGAGEAAVFFILYTILSNKLNSLIVIDEIEIGLHEEAQKKFINELKILCEKHKCQIICSTHSSTILNALPPEGRFFVESSPGSTKIIPEISSSYATGELAGINDPDIFIYVEDEVAKTIISSLLSRDERKAVSIIPIGSSDAVLRALASRYIEQGRPKQWRYCAILDGDVSTSNASNIQKFIESCETLKNEDKENIKEWISQYIQYLPSQNPPEDFLIQSAIGEKDIDYLENEWGIANSTLRGYFQNVKAEDTHNKMRELGNLIACDEREVVSKLTRLLSRQTKEFDLVHSWIKARILDAK